MGLSIYNLKVLYRNDNSYYIYTFIGLVLDVHWKDWCWSWNSNTLATWCEELTHLKRLWCWERLRAGGEGDDRGWDGWMASPSQWAWVWVDSGSWWWTGRPGVLRFMGSQSRIRLSDWTELNWTELEGGKKKLPDLGLIVKLPEFKRSQIYRCSNFTLYWW